MKLIPQRSKAQIMLVTLLTLMILGIITVGIIATTNRDVTQTVANQQYEELYNRSEEAIFTILDKYSKPDSSGNLTSLSGLLTDFAGQCTQAVAGRSYTCNVKDSTGEINTELRVNDTDVFTDYELAKDDTLTLNVAGYTGQVSLSWKNNAAIDLTLVYTTSTGEYRVVSDLFDKIGLFTSSGGDPFLAGGTHDFTFATYLSPNTNSFKVNLASGINVAAGDAPKYLLITPRMATDKGSILLSLATNLPSPQVREIVATSQVAGTTNAPVPSVRTFIPLTPQMPAVFNGYSLIVNNNVLKQPGCYVAKKTVSVNIPGTRTAWTQVPGMTIDNNTYRIEFIVNGTSSGNAATAQTLYSLAQSLGIKYTIRATTPPATGAAAYNNGSYTLLPKNTQTISTGTGYNISSTGGVWLIIGGDANYGDNQGSHTVKVTTSNIICAAGASPPVVYTIDVPANANGGINTGIPIQTGDTVTITYVSGTWTFDTGTVPASDGYTGPDGVPGRIFCCGPYSADQPDGGAVLNTLVGGLLSKWFKVGSAGTTFVASGNGNLFLADNDVYGQYGNNAGTIRVQVTVQH